MNEFVVTWVCTPVQASRRNIVKDQVHDFISRRRKKKFVKRRKECHHAEECRIKIRFIMVIAIKLAKRSFNDTIRNFPVVNFNYTFVSLYDHLLPRRNSLNLSFIHFSPPPECTKCINLIIFK